MRMRLHSILRLMLACGLILGTVPGVGIAYAKPPLPKGKVAALAGAQSGGPPSASRAVVPDDAEYVPGEVIVRFKPGASAETRRSAHDKAGATDTKRLGKLVPGLSKAELGKGVSVGKAIAAYEAQPGVEYAQPNYIKRLRATPNDPLYPALWGLNNTGQSGGTVDADIDAPEAWNVTKGSGVVIAVVDTGVDYTHADLAGNLWTNPGEIPGNEIDDDNNGYVDDVHGADTVNVDGDPFDDHGHGTHVAGIIGGKGNDGFGVPGVNWNVKIMAVKALDADGDATTESVVAAFEYLNKMGAKLSNNSWGGEYPFDTAEYQAMKAVDKLFVCAAGNSGKSTDATPHYPSAYDLPNIISVGASNRSDAKASFSNYGATTVDLFAPGEDIVSTVPVRRVFAPQLASTMRSDPIDSLSGWVQGTESGYVSHPWTLSAAASPSPPTSAANIDYVNDQWSYLVMSSGVNLGTSDPTYLNAKVRYDIEPGYDYLYVFGTSTTRGPDEWVLLDSKTGSSGGQFEDVWVDLSPLAGEQGVKVSFDMVSDEVFASDKGYEGVYVDDVRIVTAESSFIESDPISMSTSQWRVRQNIYHWGITSYNYLSPYYSLRVPSDYQFGLYPNDEYAFIMRGAPVDPGPSGIAFMRYKANLSTELDCDFVGTLSNQHHDGEVAGWGWNGDFASGDLPTWGTRISPLVGHMDADEVKFGFGFMSDDWGVRPAGFIDDLEFRSVPGTWTVAYDTAYDAWSGTSMAAPHVAGIAGLMLAARPTATPAQLKWTLADSVDKKSALSGLCVTGGRANAYRAVTTVKGTLKGVVRWRGRPLPDASIRIDTRPALLTQADGSYSAWMPRAGSHTVVISKPGYIAKTFTRVTTTIGGTSILSTDLIARPMVRRWPRTYKQIYRRKNGVARVKFYAEFLTRDWRSFVGRRVYLQSSKNGRSGWENIYAFRAGEYGVVTKTVRFKKAGTHYYRWCIPAKSGVNAKGYSTKFKVVVR